MLKKADIGPSTGAETVVKLLESQGVTHVFGIPGAKIDAVYDALVESRIETIVCRHEQNAAFMAGAIGRMTGKAGVTIVTSGPGVSNLVTGLATANSEGDPVVAFGGAVATDEVMKQLHQAMDAVAICKPVTKFSASVNAPNMLTEVVANAFRAAEGGRPGAAFVSLPKDIMAAPMQPRLLTAPAFAGPGVADPAAIREAARLINAAQHPVVLLGLLASREANANAARGFIKHADLPVVGTYQAAGAVSEQLMDHFGGRVGLVTNQQADQLLEVADLVITIGYDPVEFEPGLWNKSGDRSIIHIDTLPADLDCAYCPQVELTGDIAQTLEVLARQVTRTQKSAVCTGILQSIAHERLHFQEMAAQRNGHPIHPTRIVYELQKFVGPDVTVCVDMGSFHIWLARHLYSFRARQLLMTNGQQTLGVALPWAIAATLVRPAEKVLSISGDGGFLFSAMELETAVRLKANIVHLIWIDGTYDMVATQEVLKYGRSSGTDFGPVDPVKYAEAFGATGMMIRSADEIGPVLKRAFDTPGPVIIGLHVDYSDNHTLFEHMNVDAFH